MIKKMTKWFAFSSLVAVLAPTNGQTQGSSRIPGMFYPRAGSHSLYGMHNRGVLGARSFFERERLFQHPVSHQVLNSRTGNLW